MLSEELLEDLAAVHLHPQTQAGGDLDLTPLLRAVEAAAVAAERERCARAAASVTELDNCDHWDEMTASECVRRIRWPNVRGNAPDTAPETDDEH